MINQFLKNEPLSKHTTFKIGGKAEYYFEAKTTKELIKAVKYAKKHQLNLTIIGNGSNILVSDKGIKGLVIKNLTSKITVLAQNKSNQPSLSKKIKPRFTTSDLEAKKISKLDYQAEKYLPVLVKLDSGVTLPKAIFSLLNQGITGLEWFAGIPATIGGATYINLHGADKYFSDYLVETQVIDKDLKIKNLKASQLNFDYDYSIIQYNQNIVLTSTLRLFKGPKEIALKIAKNWALKKSYQPQQSVGCIFQNLSEKEQQKLDLPYPSIGYLIDKVLKLKGKQIGKAKISEKHAGFIENLGGAQAKEVLQLIKLIKNTAKSKLDLNLKLEINLLGEHD